jgi:hypothetical protein
MVLHMCLTDPHSEKGFVFKHFEDVDNLVREIPQIQNSYFYLLYKDTDALQGL